MAATKCLTTKNHGASGDGSRSIQNLFYADIWPSKPGYRHFMCEDIRHIGRDMTQNRIFGNGGTCYPSLPFWTIMSKLPAYHWLYTVIWPSKPGYRHLIHVFGDICNIDQTKMKWNMISGNGGTLHPGLPFSDNFDKGIPL